MSTLLDPRFRCSDEELQVYQDKVMKFEATMAIARTMLKKGIINVEEYYKSEAIIAEKYSIPPNSIHIQKNLGKYSDIPSLCNTDNDDHPAE